MKTLIVAGGTGTVGSRLIPFFEKAGWRVKALTRDQHKADSSEQYIHWDIEKGIVDKAFLEADVVVNLAGAGIAEGRWTKKRKKAIIKSRTETTRLLISESKKRSSKLEAYISASAIGYYGDGGNKVLKENTGVVTEEFLSKVCVIWEEAALEARSVSDHVSIIRIGTVLSPSGGALEKMDATIPYGIANYLGSGNQFMSWIHLDDLCGIILFLVQGRLSGTYNAVAPNTYRNKQFTKILKDTINKNAILLPAPAFGIKLAFGEMSRVVLNSSNVSAEKIVESGYNFAYPDLNSALSHLYKR